MASRRGSLVLPAPTKKASQLRIEQRRTREAPAEPDDGDVVRPGAGSCLHLARDDDVIPDL